MKHPTGQLRWIIKREQFRQPRFGENRQDVTAWAVRAYTVQADGSRATTGASYHHRLTAAHTRALNACRARYGTGEHR